MPVILLEEGDEVVALHNLELPDRNIKIPVATKGRVLFVNPSWRSAKIVFCWEGGPSEGFVIRATAELMINGGPYGIVYGQILAPNVFVEKSPADRKDPVPAFYVLPG